MFMILFVRSIMVGVFTIVYGLVSILALIFVVPLIILREKIQFSRLRGARE